MQIQTKTEPAPETEKSQSQSQSQRQRHSQRQRQRQRQRRTLRCYDTHMQEHKLAHKVFYRTISAQSTGTHANNVRTHEQNFTHKNFCLHRRNTKHKTQQKIEYSQIYAPIH